MENSISENTSETQTSNLKSKLRFPINWKKQFLAFMVLIFLFLLSIVGISNIFQIKADISKQGEKSFSELLLGFETLQEKNWDESRKHFSLARAGFENLERQYLDRYYGFIFSSPISSVDEIVALGGNLATSAEKFLDLKNKIESLSFAGIVGSSPPPRAEIKNIEDSIGGLGVETLRIKKNLDNIQTQLLPKNIQNIFIELKKNTHFLDKFGSKLVSTPDKIDKIFGLDKEKKYLLLFQNSGEIRASGGFIGSLATLTVRDGKIQITPEDIYAIDRNLKKNIKAPKALSQITKNFYLRDANFWPNFETSAKKIVEMYQLSGGDPVDGVIAIDDTLIGELLRLTGPISLDDYGISFDTDNYYYQIVKIIENKESKTRNPKQPLFDLQEKIISQLGKSGSFSDIIQILIRAANEKHLSVWFLDPALEKEMKFIDIAGDLNNQNQTSDFLAIVKTSIGANKSDKLIKEKIWHKTIFEKEKISAIITMHRRHSWDQDLADQLSKQLKLNSVEKRDLLPILGAGINKTYWRIYTPLGSSITEFNNIRGDVESFVEDRKTVFAFTSSLAPGAEERFTIKYDLPENYQESDYSEFYFWKQAGVEKNQITKIWKQGDTEVSEEKTLRTDFSFLASFSGSVLVAPKPSE